MEFRPLTAERWGDFTRLFGKRGACGGCWCMWWRRKRSDFEKGQGAGNRRAMKRIVDSGEVPGILGYEDGKAVAWCSVAPRERFGTIERSRVLKRLDDQPVWSIVCLYVAKDRRGRGVAESMVRGAVDYAVACGADIVEAYPTAPRGRRLSAVSSFVGVPAIYGRAGFRICARPSKSRVIMRYERRRRQRKKKG